MRFVVDWLWSEGEKETSQGKPRISALDSYLPSQGMQEKKEQRLGDVQLQKHNLIWKHNYNNIVTILINWAKMTSPWTSFKTQTAG